MVRRWLEVDKVATKNECNAILQYYIRLFGETISLSLSIDTLLLVFAGSPDGRMHDDRKLPEQHLYQMTPVASPMTFTPMTIKVADLLEK